MTYNVALIGAPVGVMAWTPAGTCHNPRLRARRVMTECKLSEKREQHDPDNVQWLRCLCSLKLSHYRCASGRAQHGSGAIFGRGLPEDFTAG
jgi:hypothetical protein